MAIRYQVKRATAAAWAATNPVLLAGEQALEIDTGVEKIGDGATAYNSLPSRQSGTYAQLGGTTVTPSGDTTGAADLAAMNAAIASMMTLGGTVFVVPGDYYFSGPVTVRPSQPTDIPAKVPGIVAMSSSGGIGDMADRSTVTFHATATFPLGSFLVEYLAPVGYHYGGTGAWVKGLSLDCHSRAAGFRAQAARKFHVEDVSVIWAATPVSSGDSSTAAFNMVSPRVNDGDGGAYNTITNVTVANAAQDSFFDGVQGQNTYVGCTSITVGRAAYHTINSDAGFFGCGYEQGQYAVICGTSAMPKFVGLSGYAGATNWPTKNAVLLQAGHGAAATRYPGPTFVGCHLGNKPASGVTEGDGAVVKVEQYAANLTQSAKFVGCHFSAGTYTTDWFYVAAGIGGMVPVTSCTFAGTVATSLWNDQSGILAFSDCSGIATPMSGSANSSAMTNLASSTPVDITGATATIVTPKGRLLVDVMFDVNQGSNTNINVGYLNVDGTNRAEEVIISGTVNRMQVGRRYVVPVAAGSHTIKLQGACASGANNGSTNATHTGLAWQFIADLS